MTGGLFVWHGATLHYRLFRQNQEKPWHCYSGRGGVGLTHQLLIGGKGRKWREDERKEETEREEEGFMLT